MILFARVDDLWRDRIISGLAFLMAVQLFVIVPLGATATGIMPLSIASVLLILAGLLVLSRSLLPAICLLTALLLIASAQILHFRGANLSLDASLEASGWLILGSMLAWVVARAVFAPGRITFHRVIGAILLYLAIGLVFVALFTLVGALVPGAFSNLSIHDRVSLPSDLVYFSFSTLTTVGYGDIVPMHPFARSLTNLEAIFGQLYPATLLARLVSLQLEWKA